MLLTTLFILIGLLALAAFLGAGFAARLVVGALADGSSGVRLSGTIGGLLVWLAVLAFQRRPFRLAVLRGAEPANLIVPGLAAAVGCGLLEALLILVLVR